MAIAVGENSAQRLCGFVERVEHFQEQKKKLCND
jgi:hypothetical protein